MKKKEEQKTIHVRDRRFRLFLSAEQIDKIVRNLADQISKKYFDKNPVCVVVLKGAFVFAADLIRYMEIPCEVTFLRAESYGAEMHSSGEVKITFFSNGNRLRHRHILLIEDIVDTGLTVKEIYRYLQQFKPKSIETVTLLLKPETYVGEIPAFIGKAIPSLFVIGYGMDYNENGRFLKDLYVLDTNDDKHNGK